MSPQRTVRQAPPLRFPRVSGDEPEESLKAQAIERFSPRERG